MINLSTFGASVTIISNKLFPYGFTIKNFADDVPPLSVDSTQVSSFLMLADGTKFDFDTAATVTVKLAVAPMTNDDENLRVILNSRFGKGSIFSWVPQGLIMTVSYPGNRYVILTGGSLLSGNAVTGINANGKMQTNVYTFSFNKSTGTTVQGLLTAAANTLLG
jgi:hypothetical protein